MILLSTTIKGKIMARFKSYADIAEEHHIEVFHCPTDYDLSDELSDFPDGWYWWSCFTGCLPDGDPMGPFDMEKEAYRDAVERFFIEV